MDDTQPEKQSDEDEAKTHNDPLHREKKLIDRRTPENEAHDGSVASPQHTSPQIVPPVADVPQSQKAPYANTKPPRKHEPQSGY